MTITLADSDAAADSSSSALSLTLPSTAGNFQIVYLAGRNLSMTPSITGDGWNTPTVVNGELVEVEIGDTGARRQLALFYRIVPAGASGTIQVNWGVTATKAAMAYEFNSDTSGGTWSKDNHAATDSGTTGVTSLASGSAAPANSEAVTVYGLGARVSNADLQSQVSYSDSFTKGPGASLQGANGISGFAGHRIASGTNTTTASWTTSALPTGLIAALSVATGGVAGSAAGSYSYSGSAAGRIVTDWSDTAQATTFADAVLGEAAGSYDYNGSATGQATVTGAASGSYSYAGTAAGSGAAADVEGAAAGAYGYTGTAEGVVTVTGTASGSYTYAGTGAGTAEPSTAEGTASGSYTFAGTAAGSGEAGPVDGQAAGSYTYAGTAAGEVTVTGTATGAYAYASTADGTVTRLGTAAGTYTYTGSAFGTGVIPPVPYLAVTVGPMREPVLVAAMRDPLAAAEINPEQPVTVGELRDTAPILGELRDVAPAIGELRDLLMVDEMRDPISVDELRE